MSDVRIISIHVVNFGCLHNYDMAFNEHLTAIKEQNGWGKSTLAGFIKAMFYGLDAMKTTVAASVLHKKYKPWQGGNFAGSLTFQIGERTYRIERTFSDRHKSDSFCLFDAVTSMLSYDYGENIGEVLFGVNVDTFERSVFVTLAADKVPHRSDDIAAKLGNLVQNDDMASFTDAKMRLEKAATNLKSKVRGKGVIPALEEKIAGGKALLRTIEGREKQRIITAGNLERVKAGKAGKEAAQRELQKEMTQAVYYAKKMQRDGLKTEVQAAEGKRDALLKFFHGKPIDNMDRMDALLGEYNECGTLEESSALSPQESAEYDALKPKYGNVSDDEIKTHIAEMEAAQNLTATLLALQGEKSKAENALQQKKALKTRNTPRLVWVCVAGALLLVGLAAMVLMVRVMPIVLFAVSALCCVLAILQKGKQTDTSAEEAQVAAVLDKIEEAERQKESSEKSCDEFIARILPSPSSRSRALDEIKESLGKIRGYSERINRSAQSAKRKDEARKALVELLSAADTNKGAPLNAQVKECHDNTKALEVVDNVVSSAKGALEAFDRNNKDEMDRILSARKGEKSSTQLDKEVGDIARSINECNRQIDRLTEEMNGLTSSIDTKEEVQSSINEAQDELAQRTKKYGLLGKTVSFLAMAQEELQRQYMDPMTSGFAKYVNMLDDRLSLGITGALDVTVTNDGVTHKSDALSDGYKDLVNVCARLALVDALFADERPPLILDDPFMNMDGDKVVRALDMIRELAKERQVIYFVCHKSRAI